MQLAPVIMLKLLLQAFICHLKNQGGVLSF